MPSSWAARTGRRLSSCALSRRSPVRRYSKASPALGACVSPIRARRKAPWWASWRRVASPSGLPSGGGAPPGTDAMRRGAPLVLLLLAGAAAPPAVPMRGVSWEGGRIVDAASLDPVRELGADWISQTPFGWCPSIHDPTIRLSGERGYWGETDEGLVATARWARERGLHT